MSYPVQITEVHLHSHDHPAGPEVQAVQVHFAMPHRDGRPGVGVAHFEHTGGHGVSHPAVDDPATVVARIRELALAEGAAHVRESSTRLRHTHHGERVVHDAAQLRRQALALLAAHAASAPQSGE